VRLPGSAASAAAARRGTGRPAPVLGLRRAPTGLPRAGRP
ncbi:MAG: hypothetical protein QOC64_818, partial [Solirubrobacteraceae bacterium]|nr:hypothetical protein [Solirubrobacteraceae bacterium]